MSDSSRLEADAALAVDLVREAGELAQRMRASGIATQQKTSVSDVVTAADHAAERLVVDHLAAFRPDDGVLGEEGASREGSSGRQWVIDPVDGTYNFARGLSWWCSALALVDGGELQLGAVHHPCEEAIYVGGPELPATRNGVELAPLADVRLAESCVATYLHPPFHGTEVGEAFARVAGRAATMRMTGSGTLDHVSVARGQFGVLVQHSVPPWDWLPGAALVRSVGGAARKVSAAGVEWSVAGAPRAVAEVLEALQGR